jgi:hypothetical protein
MKNIARSLRRRRELILNYFRAQKLISSGLVETSTKGRSHHEKILRLPTLPRARIGRPYPSLRKLPDPRSTHDFLLTNPVL